ncbi:E3 ubiquitin-protein ligase BRE1-like [Trichogramma pretiosum]|uniref:E3 ubiquitin-protein ligase BRE1-like n=1 Tax=Trichogramma pretiosum TaxID=7493 RepID=UPI0006C9CFCD|nr:E3 ubiquitin-protein ligase BRE1-like [Trichogramma pretiosum]
MSSGSSSEKEKQPRKRKRSTEVEKLEKEMAAMAKKLRLLQQNDIMATDADESDATQSSEENQSPNKVKQASVKAANVNEEEVASCLGELRENKTSNELDLIDDVALRVSEYLRLGLPKEQKKEILELIPRKHKDFNLVAPKINAEILHSMKEEAIKRDNFFAHYQDIAAANLALSSSVLSMVLNDQNEPLERSNILKALSDAVKLNAELYRCLNIARKIYITPAFEKKVKAVLDKAESTELLFGDKVTDLISGVKTAETLKKDLLGTKMTGSLNWRSSSNNTVGSPKNQTKKSYFARKDQQTPFTPRQNSNKKQNYRRNYTQSQPLQKKT